MKVDANIMMTLLNWRNASYRDKRLVKLYFMPDDDLDVLVLHITKYPFLDNCNRPYVLAIKIEASYNGFDMCQIIVDCIRSKAYFQYE